jgi:hypothetical protein
MSKIRSLGCIFLIALFLYSCSKKSPGFEYELNEHAYQPGLEAPLLLQVDENEVKFVITFKGGGGSYENAHLHQSGNDLKIILSDEDGIVQDMWVIYMFNGRISHIEPGNYTLTIEDSDRNIVASGSYTIQQK